MAASIGGTACTFVKGDLAPQRARLDVYYVPGLNGPGLHYLGLGDSPFSVTAVLYSTAAGLATWAALIHAQQGTIVSIVNDYGDTYANCLLTRVSELRRQAAGTTTHRGELTIQGIRTA